jgi:prepilin-type N-terminal cleavage/methylation domain-containing protein
MKTWDLQKGVTMMELVVVAVVIGLMSALAVPSFLNYSAKMEAKSEARNIVSTLRQARSKAISERVKYGVYFDAGNRRYTYFKEKSGNEQYDAGTDSLISQIALDRDISYGGNTFTNTTVVFRSDGSASSSGNLKLYSTAAGSDTLYINVLASTGRVKMDDRPIP